MAGEPKGFTSARFRTGRRGLEAIFGGVQDGPHRLGVALAGEHALGEVHVRSASRQGHDVKLVEPEIPYRAVAHEAHRGRARRRG